MTEFKLDEESRRNQAFPTSKKKKKLKSQPYFTSTEISALFGRCSFKERNFFMWK